MSNSCYLFTDFKKSFSKKTFWVFQWLLLIGLVLAFSACENDEKEIAQVTQKNNFPVETAKNIEVLYSDSAIVKAKLNAAEMKRFTGNDPHVEMPKGVNLKFFDAGMNVISTLTSNYAVTREEQQLMEARNNVIVVNQKGEKLNTEHLTWNQKTKKIYSDVFARITTADEIIYGNGFEANEDFSKYKIINVKGIINVKEKNAAGS